MEKGTRDIQLTESMMMTRGKRKAEVASCPTNDEPSQHVAGPAS